MGLIKDKIYYTYNDITILPCRQSDVEHRAECNPLDENYKLPLFTAPMDTVVNEKNFVKFEKELIYPILPRTVDLDRRIEYSQNGKWAAYSLREFELSFCDEKCYVEVFYKPFTKIPIPLYALIDVANGHMKKITDLAKKAKEIYGDNIVIMAGNIANPETYIDYADAGIDYCRVGIGGGNGCITSTQTGIHMPMASLIDEIHTIKNRLADMLDDTLNPKYNKLPKIVADGGIREYRDIIKALALGADYVMIGSVFARMLESAAPKDYVGASKYPIGVFKDLKKTESGWIGKVVEDGEEKSVLIGNIYVNFYGMASKQGQIALNGAKTKTSEGTLKRLNVDYTMHGWVDNFIDFIRSEMSYNGHFTLDEVKENTVTIINSQNAVNAVNK